MGNVMAIQKEFKNDIGTKIRLDAGQSIADQTQILIRYKKPDDSVAFWTAILEGTDYGIYYTEDGDLDQTGVWELQLYIETSTGWKGHGDILKMYVYKRVTD